MDFIKKLIAMAGPIETLAPEAAAALTTLKAAAVSVEPAVKDIWTSIETLFEHGSTPSGGAVTLTAK